jgi:hypothetical protein
MHQQLWGYKVKWKSFSRGTGGKKVEYHCLRALGHWDRQETSTMQLYILTLLLTYGILATHCFKTTALK